MHILLNKKAADAKARAAWLFQYLISFIIVNFYYLVKFAIGTRLELPFQPFCFRQPDLAKQAKPYIGTDNLDQELSAHPCRSAADCPIGKLPFRKP